MGRVGRPRSAHPVALAALTAGLLLLPVGVALGHAQLVALEPADGARLEASPATVTITFNEPVGLAPGGLQVIDSSGASVDLGEDVLAGPTISQPLPPLADGWYVVTWGVISEDGHVVRALVGVLGRPGGGQRTSWCRTGRAGHGGRGCPCRRGPRSHRGCRRLDGLVAAAGSPPGGRSAGARGHARGAARHGGLGHCRDARRRARVVVHHRSPGGRRPRPAPGRRRRRGPYDARTRPPCSPSSPSSRWLAGVTRGATRSP